MLGCCWALQLPRKRVPGPVMDGCPGNTLVNPSASVPAYPLIAGLPPHQNRNRECGGQREEGRDLVLFYCPMMNSVPLFSV